MRQGVLSLFLTAISRAIFREDRQSGRMARILDGFAFSKERLVIESGGRRLSAVYVSAGSSDGENAPVVLICHGIGELVEYWGGVQGLLREMGISSLVFNYSGYGDSKGRVSVANCEEDALAAYKALVERGHRSIVLLGFSMGTGVGCAVASRMDLDGLVLCEGFSSLREAGMAMGFPRWMTHGVPDAWDTVNCVGELRMPVLVVHSDADGLFPVSMAERVAMACGGRGELLVIPGISHNAPIFEPTEDYWEPIAEWAKARSSALSATRSGMVGG
jgi:pimeloyl-ACP methyl ester carboxylesterase